MKKSTKVALAVASTLSFASASSFAATALTHQKDKNLLVKAHVITTCIVSSQKVMDFGQIIPGSNENPTATAKVSVSHCYTPDGQNPELFVSTNTGSTNEFQMKERNGNAGSPVLKYELLTTDHTEFTPYEQFGTGHYDTIKVHHDGTGQVVIKGKMKASDNGHYKTQAGHSYSQNVTVQVVF